LSLFLNGSVAKAIPITATSESDNR
jgi:hypothetical protein